MEVGVYYYFHLPMEQQPDYLTFTQQFGGSDAPVPSVMDLILLQKGARLDFPVQIGPRSPTRSHWIGKIRRAMTVLTGKSEGNG